MVLHDRAHRDQSLALGHERLEGEDLVGFHEGTADANLHHGSDGFCVDRIRLPISQRPRRDEAMAFERIDEHDAVAGRSEAGAEQEMVHAGRFNADRGLSGRVPERLDFADKSNDAVRSVLELSDEQIVERGVEGRLAHVDSDGKHISIRVRAVKCREKKERGKRETRVQLPHLRAILETQVPLHGWPSHN